MKSIRKELYDILRNSCILVILLAVFLLFGFIAPNNRATFAGKDGATHLTLQTTCNKDTFIKAIEGWKQEGELKTPLRKYKKFLLQLDLVFPLLYAFLGASLIAWSTYDPNLNEKKMGRILLLFSLPFIAALSSSF